MIDQPTSASAAAWRGFILLFLEAGIVGRDYHFFILGFLYPLCGPVPSTRQRRLLIWGRVS